MGFLSKLKANIHHGGVKLAIQMPGTVTSDQAIPVTVNITTDTPQTINSITVRLEAEEREQGVNIAFGSNNMDNARDNNENTGYQMVAQVENRDQFTIAPGDTKTVSLQLYLNNIQFGQTGPMSQALGGVLQAIAAHGFTHMSLVYRVHVSADVEGISLGPSESLPIQIAPPASQQASTQPTAVPNQGNDAPHQG
jgi:hypothetical protein